jgi:hypothetical protein
MQLLVSMVAFGFGFFAMVGARHFMRELLALANRRPPELFIEPHDDSKES